MRTWGARWGQMVGDVDRALTVVTRKRALHRGGHDGATLAGQNRQVNQGLSARTEL